MQYPGWWISGDKSKATIIRSTFDETELSETSGRTEAHQNEDPEGPNGYLRWAASLAEVERRLEFKSE